VDGHFIPLLIGCVLAVGSALAVVVARKPVYAVVALLAHSLSLAGLYAILGAAFIAVGQVLIYSGAIVVLFLIVVTLLPVGQELAAPTASRLIGAVLAGLTLMVALSTALAVGAPVGAAIPGTVYEVGRTLFVDFIVPVQVLALLLLVAVVGAVAIWRRHEPQLPAEQSPRERVRDRRMVLHR
jgi:NADH-quinone oxidoreductase subunit J